MNLPDDDVRVADLAAKIERVCVGESAEIVLETLVAITAATIHAHSFGRVARAENVGTFFDKMAVSLAVMDLSHDPTVH